LSYNQLSGSIPPELGNLANLTELGLSSNQLSGSIPTELGNLANLYYLYLSSNQLSGSIPASLSNLINLWSTNIDYNALYTNDQTLRTFLNSKDPDWEATQTIAPGNLTADPVSPTSTRIWWTPISYTAGPGGYLVFYSSTSGGPYTLFGTTSDKTASQIEVTGIDPGTICYFVVQTKTDSHYWNDNIVHSEYSEEVAAEGGDINGDCTVDLADAILALQVLAGVDASGLIRSEYASSGVDVNGDNRVGLEEVIYILQKVSDLRQ
jgi:hypothetical protein